MPLNRTSNMKLIPCIQLYEKKTYFLNNNEYYTPSSHTKYVGDKNQHNMRNIACNTSLRAVQSTVNFKDFYKTSYLNRNIVKPFTTENTDKTRKTAVVTKHAVKNSAKLNNKSTSSCVDNRDTQKREPALRNKLISLMPARHRVTSVIKTKKTLEYNKTKVADVRISSTDELEVKNYKEMSDDEFDLENNPNLSNIETCVENENICTQKEQTCKTEREMYLDKILDEILIAHIIECIKEFSCDNCKCVDYSKFATGEIKCSSGNGSEFVSAVVKNPNANDNMKYKYDTKSNIIKPICYDKLESPIQIFNGSNRFIPNNYLVNNDPVIKSIQLKGKPDDFFLQNNDFESIQIFEGIKEVFKRKFKKKYYVKRNKKNNKKNKRYYKYLNTYLNMKKDLQKRKLKLTLKQFSRKKSKEFSGRVIWKCRK